MGTPSAQTIPKPLPEGRYIASPFESWTPQDGTAVISKRRETMKRLFVLHSTGNGLLAATVEYHPYVFEPSTEEDQIFEYTDGPLPDQTERIRVTYTPSLGGISTWNCIESGLEHTEGRKVKVEHETGKLKVLHNTYRTPQREVRPEGWREDPLGSNDVFVNTVRTMRDLTNYLQTPGLQPSAVLLDPNLTSVQKT